MERYYIYCSNNQVYHALINNDITSKAIMPEDFKSDTVSFLSDNFIFLTKDRLKDEIRLLGISDVYYPIILEIIDKTEKSSIPVRLLTLTEEGDVALSDETILSEYTNTDNCLGAFVLGEIPISYLSGIIFDTEEQRTGFKKSSLDLWFPDDLYKEWTIGDASESIINEDLLKKASIKADELYDTDCYQRINKIIVNRIRIKAASYFAIDATAEWSAGNIKTNIDEALMRYLDGEEGILSDAVKKGLKKAKLDSEDPYVSYLDSKDVVFGTDDDINRKIFDVIIAALLNQTDIRGSITETPAFDDIERSIIEIVEEERDEAAKALTILNKFLRSTNMDPDVALEAMGKYNVLRSFMLFCDQPKDSDFMKRSCKKLSQEEKRYTYMMYGVLNGMSQVEREQKANRALEYRLEELVCRHYKDTLLINEVLPINETEFLEKGAIKNKDNSVYGIIFSANIWYDCESSQKKLLDSDSDKELETVYKLMAKMMKDEPIPEEDVYAFEPPIVVSLHIEGKDRQDFTIKNKTDAKEYGKKIERIINKEKEVFLKEEFKKYLAEERRYRKFYKKNAEKLQVICRKA